MKVKSIDHSSIIHPCLYQKINKCVLQSKHASSNINYLRIYLSLVIYLLFIFHISPLTFHFCV